MIYIIPNSLLCLQVGNHVYFSSIPTYDELSYGF